MILVDINVPDKCIRCPMSCQIPKVPTSTDFDGGFYEYICRVDYKEHTPMDDTCPIKAEIPDNATNGDVIRLLFPFSEPYISCSKDWWNAPYKAESEG